MLTAGDEAGDMRHVDEEKRAHFIGDLAQPRIIEEARVGGSAGSDHGGLRLFRQPGKGVVIDPLGFFIHAVMRDLVKLAGEIGGMPVGKMATVGKVHGQDAVADLEGGKVDRHVGLGAAVRLDVGVFGTEEAFGAVDGELFHRVDIFAAAVPAFAGVALGIFVREHAALGFHDRAAGKIFRGDELDVLALPLFLGLHSLDRSPDPRRAGRLPARGKMKKKGCSWEWKKCRRSRVPAGTASSPCSTNASTLGKALLMVRAQLL